MGKSMPKMRRPDTGWHFELIHPRLVTTIPARLRPAHYGFLAHSIVMKT